MALLEAPWITIDPDFTEDVVLVQRLVTVNDYGENEMTETMTACSMIIQRVNAETLKRLPQAAQLSDLITAIYQGKLTTESPGGYSDEIITGDSRRYQVISIDEGFSSLPMGFTLATCSLKDTLNEAWLLETGHWNDLGQWVQTAVWEDG